MFQLMPVSKNKAFTILMIIIIKTWWVCFSLSQSTVGCLMLINHYGISSTQHWHKAYMDLTEHSWSFCTFWQMYAIIKNIWKNSCLWQNRLKLNSLKSHSFFSKNTFLFGHSSVYWFPQSLHLSLNYTSLKENVSPPKKTKSFNHPHAVPDFCDWILNRFTN